MSFESPSLVRRCVRRIEENDVQRQEQRSWINRLFNGDPPYTRAEADAEGIEWNYNDKQAAKLAHDARGRFNNAHLSTNVYFNCKLDSGPAYKRTEWETLVTSTIGKLMKRSLEFETSEREVFAQVALHGPGPAMWPDKYCWKCESIGLMDLKVPSLTYVNLKNLQYFGIYKEYTPGELWKKIDGPKVDQGWKVSLVKKCIQRAIDKTDAGESYDNGLSTYSLNPEKFWEQFRANLGFWCSDAAQVIRCYDFYYQDAKSGKWRRRIVLADQSEIDDKGDGAFLYNPRRDYADDLSEFFHCQFADYNNVAPFYFGSVRGLGHLLYDLCFASNRISCKITESAFLQMMMLFVVGDPQDRDRMDKMMLHDKGVIPDGLRIVPNTERYSPNQNIVSAAYSNLQNSINQNSSSFTNDAALGSDKEQTLGEWTGKLSIYNQMVSATLDLSYRYQAHKYREILRRFFLKNSPDKDVQKFQEQVIKKGLPKQFLDIERWEVIPERVMGGGNRTLAVQEAQAIFASRFAYSPRGQQIAAHDLVMALTNDPGKANALVELGEPTTNNTAKYTEALFGSLMQGIMPKAEDVSDHISVIETMIGMMSAVVQQYAEAGMMPPDKIGGLKTCVGYTDQHLQLLKQDPNEKARVKQYSDDLKGISNQIKAFEQRAVQQAEAQNGGAEGNGEMAKLQMEQARGQQKMQLDQQKVAQKMQQKNEQFVADQKRRDLTTAADIADQQARTEAEIAQDNVAAVHDIRRNTAEEVAKTNEMT